MPKPCVVAVAMILGGGSSLADQPNQLNPRKVGSGAITTGVESCMISAKKNQPGATDLAYLKYCGCFMDYMRNAVKDDFMAMQRFQENLDPAKLTGAANTCADFALEHKDQRIPTEPTPYSKGLDLPSEAVFSGYMGCEQASKDNLTSNQRIGFCSCVADVFRTLSKKKRREIQLRKLDGRPALPLMPQKKIQFCAASNNVRE